MTQSRLKRFRNSAMVKLFSPVKRLGVNLPNVVTQHAHCVGVVTVPVGKGKEFRIRSYGHKIENRLYWYGVHGHEPETFLPWLAVAESARVVLDIGANTALYSLGAGAVNPAAAIFAFEPLPRVAQLARDNAALNPEANITVCEYAVCDADGQVTLHDPGGDQPTSASLADSFLDCPQDPIAVEAIRIDEFVRKHNLETVDLIKLDVEGVEELALAGMLDTVERFRPTLFIEVLDDRPSLVDMLKKLVGFGYEIGDLRQSGIVPQKLEKMVCSERNLVLTQDLSNVDNATRAFRNQTFSNTSASRHA